MPHQQLSYALLEGGRERRAEKRHAYAQHLALAALVAAAVALTLGAVSLHKSANLHAAVADNTATTAKSVAMVRVAAALLRPRGSPANPISVVLGYRRATT